LRMGGCVKTKEASPLGGITHREQHILKPSAPTPPRQAVPMAEVVDAGFQKKAKEKTYNKQNRSARVSHHKYTKHDDSRRAAQQSSTTRL